MCRGISLNRERGGCYGRGQLEAQIRGDEVSDLYVLGAEGFAERNGPDWSLQATFSYVGWLAGSVSDRLVRGS